MWHIVVPCVTAVCLSCHRCYECDDEILPQTSKPILDIISLIRKQLGVNHSKPGRPNSSEMLIQVESAGSMTQQTQRKRNGSGGTITKVLPKLKVILTALRMWNTLNVYLQVVLETLVAWVLEHLSNLITVISYSVWYLESHANIVNILLSRLRSPYHVTSSVLRVLSSNISRAVCCRVCLIWAIHVSSMLLYKVSLSWESWMNCWWIWDWVS